jgi:hypothetical protein
MNQAEHSMHEAYRAEYVSHCTCADRIAPLSRSTSTHWASPCTKSKRNTMPTAKTPLPCASHCPRRRSPSSPRRRASPSSARSPRPPSADQLTPLADADNRVKKSDVVAIFNATFAAAAPNPAAVSKHLARLAPDVKGTVDLYKAASVTSPRSMPSLDANKSDACRQKMN